MKRAKKIGLCNWCGATGPFVKSHVIAKSFCRIIQDDEPHAFLMQSNKKPEIETFVCRPASTMMAYFASHVRPYSLSGTVTVTRSWVKFHFPNPS